MFDSKRKTQIDISLRTMRYRYLKKGSKKVEYVDNLNEE